MSDHVCVNCPNSAKRLVVYISRHDGHEIRRVSMCDDHIQEEIVLSVKGLSMVDFTLRPLEDA